MDTQRILIADRDRALLKSYRRYLTHCGFEVETATDALSCVAQLRAFTPDLLILEPELPWGQSDGVLALMYQDESIPVVPILVLADDLNADGEHRVGAFPVNDYQAKPIAPEALAEKVRSILERTRREKRRRGKIRV